MTRLTTSLNLIAGLFFIMAMVFLVTSGNILGTDAVANADGEDKVDEVVAQSADQGGAPAAASDTQLAAISVDDINAATTVAGEEAATIDNRSAATTVTGEEAATIANAAPGDAGATQPSGNTKQSVSGEPETIDWMALMPEGWDPYEAMGSSIVDHSSLDPLPVNTVMAPVVDELDGRLVKLPGYIVPLDFDITEISEFLLVPYVGACVHVPPPPSNQVVYAESNNAFSMDGMWDPVWITGTIRTAEFTSDLADAGYTMDVNKVEPYFQE